MGISGQNQPMQSGESTYFPPDYIPRFVKGLFGRPLAGPSWWGSHASAPCTSGQLNISNRSHSAHSGPYGWPYGVLIHPMDRLHSHIIGLIRAGLPEIRSHTQVGHWQPSRYGGRQTWWWRRAVVRPLHSLTSASPVPPLARVIRYDT